MKALVVVFISVILNTAALASDKNIEACFSYVKGQDYQNAIASGKKAIRSSPKKFDSHFCLGAAYKRVSNYKLALPELKKSESLAANKDNLVSVTSFLGNTYNEMGNKDEALKYFNRQLLLARELEDSSNISSALSNIAGIFFQLNQYEKAIQYYQDALNNESNEQEKSKIYGNIAGTLSNQNKLDEALEYLLKAVTIDEKIGDFHELAIHTIKLAHNYFLRRDYKAAETTALDGLKKIRSVGDLQWEGVALQKLGWIYDDTGQKDRAKEYLKMAIAIYNKIGSNSLNGAQEDLAQLEKH